MKRWLATAAMVLGLLGVLVAPAHADPTNAPGALTFTAVCDNGASYTVIGVPGGGQGTPGMVIEGNQVLVPFVLDVKVTDLDSGQVVFEFHVSREPAERTATTTCDLVSNFTQDGVDFRLTGTAVVLSQPLLVSAD
jgi:hypothetical protein